MSSSCALYLILVALTFIYWKEQGQCRVAAHDGHFRRAVNDRVNDETFASDDVESPTWDDSMAPWQGGKAIAAAVRSAVVGNHAIEFGGHGDNVFALLRLASRLVLSFEVAWVEAFL